MNGVAGSGTNDVATDVAEETPIRLHREPPDSGCELERRVTITNRLSHDLFAVGARRAVQGGAQALPRIGVALPEIRRVGAKLRAKGRGTTPSPISCLTSAGRDADARHIRIVPAPVLDGASIAADETAGLSVQ
jgi:hypothetical protein